MGQSSAGTLVTADAFQKKKWFYFSKQAAIKPVHLQQFLDDGEIAVFFTIFHDGCCQFRANERDCLELFLGCGVDINRFTHQFIFGTAILLSWFRITNQLTVTGIKMSIAFLLLTQGLLQYSKLHGRDCSLNIDKTLLMLLC